MKLNQFIWLRKNRHLLFDEKFQQELAKIYKDSTVGLAIMAQELELPIKQVGLGLIAKLIQQWGEYAAIKLSADHH